MRMNVPVQKPRRRAANITLDSALLAEAKAAGINISQACEKGLASDLKAARWAKWREENAEAIEGWNRWVAEHGLPLEEYRLF